MLSPMTGNPKPAADADPWSSDFDDLFRCHYPAVLSFFRQRGFSSEDSLDLAQDTFLQVYRGLYMNGFRGEGRFTAWVRQIAANRYKQTLRLQIAQKRPRMVLGIEGLEEIPLDGASWLDRGSRDPLGELLLEETLRFVREGLQGLPPQMRQAALFRFDRGYKYREIADLMAISIDTVKAHIHQAKLHLRRKLRKLRR